MNNTHYFNSKQQPNFFPLSERLNYDTDNPDSLFSEIINYYDNVYHINEEIERVRAAWACISSKTFRESKSKEIPYVIDVHQNLVKAYPVHERQKSKAPDRSDVPVNRFSKKSALRLMERSKQIDYNLYSLPYFVTLTYNSNMQDCIQAKKHFRNFIKRLKRFYEKECFVKHSKLPDPQKVNYIWKMEFQERGAIHFHIALFLPEKLKNRLTYTGLKSKKNQMVLLQNYVSSTWNDVTDESINNLKYGTQVRYVSNHHEAIGYMHSYLKKTEQTENEATGKTGRFWGFSYGFDFSAIYSKCTGIQDAENIHKMLTEINDQAFIETYSYLQESFRRANSIKNRVKMIKKKKKIINQAKRQILRYKKNKFKIDKGFYMQFQVSAASIIPFLKKIPVHTKRSYFDSRFEILSNN